MNQITYYYTPKWVNKNRTIDWYKKNFTFPIPTASFELQKFREVSGIVPQLKSKVHIDISNEVYELKISGAVEMVIYEKNNFGEIIHVLLNDKKRRLL